MLRRGRSRRRGRTKKYPRLAARARRARDVQNLLHDSPVFRKQPWQRFRIKDTERGLEVWEVNGAQCWWKGVAGWPTRRHGLIVARTLLTNAVKAFVSNRVPGERGLSRRRLRRVAFGRWSVESCFRQAKAELGLDHDEVRGWRCLHRHVYLTQRPPLFRARRRQKFDDATTADDALEHLTTEQVRRALTTWLEAARGQLTKETRLQRALAKQPYYQRRNAQSRRAHTKRRKAKLRSLGSDVHSAIASLIGETVLDAVLLSWLPKKWRCPTSD